MCRISGAESFPQAKERGSLLHNANRPKWQIDTFKAHLNPEMIVWLDATRDEMAYKGKLKGKTVLSKGSISM